MEKLNHEIASVVWDYLCKQRDMKDFDNFVKLTRLQSPGPASLEVQTQITASGTTVNCTSEGSLPAIAEMLAETSSTIIGKLLVSVIECPSGIIIEYDLGAALYTADIIAAGITTMAHFHVLYVLMEKGLLEEKDGVLQLIHQPVQ